MTTLDGSIFGPESACFGCSPAHPAGFHLAFTEEKNEAGELELVTRFTPRSTDQGPPGVMHGGLVMTLADELAAWVLVARLGKFGFTAKVNAKLLKPTRVGEVVEGRGRLLKSGTRLAEVAISLRQGGAETFRGELTFALLDRAAAEKLMGRAMPAEWLSYSSER